MPRIVKIAVVGSGLAGLTTAHLLSRTPRHTDVEFDVHVFEKASSLGMHSSSVSLPVAEGEKEWRVDVPMRSFQGGYYPQLIALYKRIGVSFRQADFSYSFSLLSVPKFSKYPGRNITTTLIYNGDSGRNGISMPSAIQNAAVAAAKTQPPSIRAAMHAFGYGLFLLNMLWIAFCYARLQWLAIPIRRDSEIRHISFQVWATRSEPKGLIAWWLGADARWKEFVHDVLVPLFSAVCTASSEDVMGHPVEEFLDYIWLTLGTHHYTVTAGIRDVVARLTSQIPQSRIHLASPISIMQPDPSDASLVSVTCAGGRIYHGFSHVVFATQASHASPLLETYISGLPEDSKHYGKVEAQERCLRRFMYCPTVVVNHTDSTLLPDSISDRRDLNLIRADPTFQTVSPAPHESDENVLPSTYCMATHVLKCNPSASAAPTTAVVYQTTNPIVPISEEHTLSVARLERAVLTLDAKVARRKLHREGQRRWWQRAAEARGELGPLQGAGGGGPEARAPGFWVVGSYASSGIPLLEGCVVSARNVVEQGIWKTEGLKVTEKPW